MSSTNSTSYIDPISKIITHLAIIQNDNNNKRFQEIKKNNNKKQNNTTSTNKSSNPISKITDDFALLKILDNQNTNNSKKINSLSINSTPSSSDSIKTCEMLVFSNINKKNISFKGLLNRGVSCWLNVILQQFCHTEESATMLSNRLRLRVQEERSKPSAPSANVQTLITAHFPSNNAIVNNIMNYFRESPLGEICRKKPNSELDCFFGLQEKLLYIVNRMQRMLTIPREDLDELLNMFVVTGIIDNVNKQQDATEIFSTLIEKFVYEPHPIIIDTKKYFREINNGKINYTEIENWNETTSFIVLRVIRPHQSMNDLFHDYFEDKSEELQKVIRFAVSNSKTKQITHIFMGNEKHDEADLYLGGAPDDIEQLQRVQASIIKEPFKESLVDILYLHTKKKEISRIPNMIELRINRVSNTTNPIIEMEFSIQPYLSDALASSTENKSYFLHSVMCRSAGTTASSCHFYFYVRHYTAGGQLHHICLNDNRVSLVSPTAFQEDINKNGYNLFYRKK